MLLAEEISAVPELFLPDLRVPAEAHADIVLDVSSFHFIAGDCTTPAVASNLRRHLGMVTLRVLHRSRTRV